MNINNVKIIEIEWEGPFTMEEISTKNGSNDFGLYMAYGHHRVYGENVLLYVGKAEQQKFSVRILQHLNDDWWGTESIYLGRLGGAESSITFSEWDEQIDYTETKFIQYCLPSWNASKINSRKQYSFNEAIILNNGVKLNSIPRVLCDWIFNISSFKNNLWKAYNNEMNEKK
jgi:hypothetical protein